MKESGLQPPECFREESMIRRITGHDVVSWASKRSPLPHSSQRGQEESLEGPSWWVRNRRMDGVWGQVKLFLIHMMSRSVWSMLSCKRCSLVFPGPPMGSLQSQPSCSTAVCRVLVDLLGHLAMLSLLKIRLCNHLNKEQGMTLEVEKVYEVSSFLLSKVDPGQMMS